MRNATRKLFNAYLARQASLNGVDSARELFNVAPVVEQALIAKLGISSDFMSRINTVPVLAQQGARVGVGITRPIASRTNTAAGNRRTPTDPTGTDDRGAYNCIQTNSDTAIKYATLDMWAHRPEFQTLIRDQIVAQKGRDVIMIGFNGTSAAASTDITANPLLQDVNFGWLYKIRQFAAAQRVAHGSLDNAKIYVSDTADAAHRDYVNLDALVFDMVELLAPWYRDSTDLVVILGRDLLHDKYFNIVNTAGDDAVKMLARDVILSTKQVGGLPAARVPFFPAGSLLITSFANLSYYWQLGTMRRLIEDQPALDQIATFDSVNDAFVVEDYDKTVLVENIEMGPKPAQ